MLLDVKHSKTIRVMSYKLTYANFSPKKYSPVHTLSVFRSISAVSGVKAWIFKYSQRNPQKQGGARGGVKVWNSEPSHRNPMSISNKQALCERVNDLFGIKLRI